MNDRARSSSASAITTAYRRDQVGEAENDQRHPQHGEIVQPVAHVLSLVSYEAASMVASISTRIALPRVDKRGPPSSRPSSVAHQRCGRVVSCLVKRGRLDHVAGQRFGSDAINGGQFSPLCIQRTQVSPGVLLGDQTKSLSSSFRASKTALLTAAAPRHLGHRSCVP